MTDTRDEGVLTRGAVLILMCSRPASGIASQNGVWFFLSRSTNTAALFGAVFSVRQGTTHGKTLFISREMHMAESGYFFAAARTSVATGWGFAHVQGSAQSVATWIV